MVKHIFCLNILTYVVGTSFHTLSNLFPSAFMKCFCSSGLLLDRILLLQFFPSFLVVVVHSPSHVQLFATPWTQHSRLLCPLPSPGVFSNSCLLSWRCHPTISSSVVTFSSCLQSFLASESFPMSWLFTSGGQSIGASASASVLPMNVQGWCLRHSSFFVVQLSQLYMTTGKTTLLATWIFVGKVMSLLCHMLSRLVISFSSKEQVSFNIVCSDFVLC